MSSWATATDPSSAGRGAGFKDVYVSQCKVCQVGVYGSQPWQWSRRPLGIVHTACKPGGAP